MPRIVQHLVAAALLLFGVQQAAPAQSSQNQNPAQPAAAEADTQQVVASQRPASGVVWVPVVQRVPPRSGVRIVSRNGPKRIIRIHHPAPGAPPAVPPQAMPQQQSPPLMMAQGAGDGVTQADLYRLERSLRDQIGREMDRLRAGSAPYPAVGGGDTRVVVVPVEGGGYTTVPTSLIEEARASQGQTITADGGRIRLRADSTGAVQALPVVSPNIIAATSPDVRVVERAILDRGLFRTIEVVFEFDESTLLPVSTRTLDAVGEVLTRNPELVIEVAGHTDSIGTEAYNEELSQARAATVRQYLLDRFSLDPNRLVARGYGEARPIADNSTPTGRTLNRRVEFVVIE